MVSPFDPKFDEGMMRRAIELAQLGRYSNHPNPRVGCVLTLGERIVGESFLLWLQADPAVVAVPPAVGGSAERDGVWPHASMAEPAAAPKRRRRL